MQRTFLAPQGTQIAALPMALQQPRGLLHSFTVPSRSFRANLPGGGKAFHHFNGGRACLSLPPRRFLVAPLAAKPNKDAMESLLGIDELDARWEYFLIALNAVSTVIAIAVLGYTNIDLFGTYGALVKDNAYMISSTVAIIALGYKAVVGQREEQLSEWKASICDVFERNALAGPEALKEFPKGLKVYRADAITLGLVVGFGCSFVAYNDIPLIDFVGAALGGFISIVVSNQSERDVDTLEELRKVYKALLKSDFSNKILAPPKKSLGFWGFSPFFSPVILYGVLAAAFRTAEKFGISVEHVVELNFAVSTAASFVYYIIDADVCRQIDAEEECYRAANKAFALRKNEEMKKRKDFSFSKVTQEQSSLALNTFVAFYFILFLIALKLLSSLM